MSGRSDPSTSAERKGSVMYEAWQKRHISGHDRTTYGEEREAMRSGIGRAIILALLLCVSRGCEDVLARGGWQRLQ